MEDGGFASDAVVFSRAVSPVEALEIREICKPDGGPLADFLGDGGFENLLEACNELSLTPQELWDQIMQEAGIPKHEMPATIQTDWKQ